MKITGIICELNPAHNGHKYIFDKARELTGADYIIAVMSGDYVQRGEPAIMDKHTRTRMALMLGADAVFELPVMWATGSAQYFARGAVAILKSLGVNAIAFGSECGDIQLLEKQEFHTPNDILGREYIKAIKYLKANITPYAITRIGTDYHDTATIMGDICSASYVREAISHGGSLSCQDTLSRAIPAEIYGIICQNAEDGHLVFPDSVGSQVYYKLNSESSQGYEKYFDVYPDLSDKIIKNLNAFTCLTDFCHIIKSKDIAFSHIKRALLHIALCITKDDVEKAINKDYLTYIRLLGFKKESTDLLAEIKKASTIPIISKLADAHNILDDFALHCLEQDISSSHLYSMLQQDAVINEYSRPIIIQ